MFVASVLCWGAADAAKPKKKQPSVEEMERRLETLDAELERLAMELNRKKWECYMILAEREGRVPGFRTIRA